MSVDVWQVDGLIKEAASSKDPKVAEAHTVFKKLAGVLGGSFETSTSAESVLSRAGEFCKFSTVSLIFNLQ